MDVQEKLRQAKKKNPQAWETSNLERIKLRETDRGGQDKHKTLQIENDETSWVPKRGKKG